MNIKTIKNIMNNDTVMLFFGYFVITFGGFLFFDKNIPIIKIMALVIILLGGGIVRKYKKNQAYYKK